MKTSSLTISRPISAVFATIILAVFAGCVNYVHPAKRNTADKNNVYTRAESIPAEQRLVEALLTDKTFLQHYATKVKENDGAIPIVQVSHLENLSTFRHTSLLAAIRRDLETALRVSGRFILSGDPDACDYLLCGEYRDITDGKRVTHQLALRLHDISTDLDVWTGTDEIAKEFSYLP